MIDCLDGLRSTPPESVDLIVTDPPYGIDYVSGRYIDGNPFGSIQGDQSIDPRWLDEAYRVLKEGSAIYIFTRFDVYPDWKKEVEKRFDFKNVIVWVKNNHTAGDLEGNFGYQHEFIIYATKGRHILRGKRQTNVWYANRVNDGIHPTQKPTELYENAILASSNKGDLVCDPFFGSGTCGVASQTLKRRYLGFEIDPRYFETASNRVSHIQTTLF